MLISYLATTWLFVTWNALFIIVALHRVLAPPTVYTVEVLVATALALRRYGASGGDISAIALTSDATRPVMPASAAPSTSGVPAIVTAFLAPTATDTFEGATTADLAAACDDNDASGLLRPRPPPFAACCSCCCRGRFARNLFSLPPERQWYLASICILAAYIGVNISLSSAAPESGRYLCLVTVASVLLIDACVAAMWHGAMLRSAGAVSAVSTAARVALIAYGTEFWLLGQCTVYAVLGIFLAHMLVSQRFASNVAFVTLRSAILGTPALAPTAVKTAVPAAAAPPPSPSTPRASLAGPRRWLTSAIRALFHPAGLLLAVTVVFTVFVAGLAVALDRHSSTLPNKRVPTIQGSVPQYAFGVGAICVVAIWLCAETTARLWIRDRRSFSRVGWSFAAITWVVCAVCGGVLASLTLSYVILACGVFLPPLAIALLYSYGQWVRDDYVCLLPAGFEIAKIRSGGFSSDASRNWAMVCSVVTVFASLCGFGAVISTMVRQANQFSFSLFSPYTPPLFDACTVGHSFVDRLGCSRRPRNDYLHCSPPPAMVWHPRIHALLSVVPRGRGGFPHRCAREFSPHYN